jgi:hypothetical protein
LVRLNRVVAEFSNPFLQLFIMTTQKLITTAYSNLLFAALIAFLGFNTATAQVSFQGRVKDAPLPTRM